MTEWIAGAAGAGSEERNLIGHAKTAVSLICVDLATLPSRIALSLLCAQIYCVFSDSSFSSRAIPPPCTSRDESFKILRELERKRKDTTRTGINGGGFSLFLP